MDNKVTITSKEYGECIIVFPRIEALNPLQWVQLIEHIKTFYPE